MTTAKTMEWIRWKDYEINLKAFANHFRYLHEEWTCLEDVQKFISDGHQEMFDNFCEFQTESQYPIRDENLKFTSNLTWKDDK